jgi:peroxiredoxin
MARRRGLIIALVAGALLVAVLLAFLRARPGGPLIAPDFAVTDLDGRAVRLSALRGRVVLLNVWTTWCAPCREEMPSLDRLHARLRERAFTLLAVSQDEEGRRAVEPFVQQTRLSFPVYLDPEHQVGDRYGVWGYPETFVIDRNGIVVERVIGPRDWASPEAIKQLEALIAAGDGTPPAPAPPAPS